MKSFEFTMSLYNYVPLKFRQWVERISYKPGWEFSIDDMAQPQIGALGTLHVRALLQDSRSKEHLLIPIGMDMPIPNFFELPQADEEMFKRWMRGVLRKMEDHELDEWFMLDGVLVDDPHKEAPVVGA